MCKEVLIPDGYYVVKDPNYRIRLGDKFLFSSSVNKDEWELVTTYSPARCERFGDNNNIRILITKTEDQRKKEEKKESISIIPSISKVDSIHSFTITNTSKTKTVVVDIIENFTDCRLIFSDPIIVEDAAAMSALLGDLIDRFKEIMEKLYKD
jgi:hypothetical protein